MNLGNRRFFTLAAISAALLFPDAGTCRRASAQPLPAQCPTLRVTCPDSVSAGEALSFTVNVSGGDPQVTPTFNWSISAGTISSGQGTSTITVDTAGVAGDSTVTATVDIGGFDRSCAVASSCTTAVNKKAEARKIDEFGQLKRKDGQARLDNFALELGGDPTARGYLIAYGGRRSRAGEAKKAAAQARNYLIKTRRVAPQRVVAVDGGYREEPLMELWIAPAGGQAPEATPSLDPAELMPAKPAKSAKPKQTRRKKS